MRALTLPLWSALGSLPAEVAESARACSYDFSKQVITENMFTLVVNVLAADCVFDIINCVLVTF